MLFFLFIWLRWFVVQGYALKYQPYKKRYKTSASIIIPVVDEPKELFADVLRRICKQRPHEIIVIINGPRNPELEKVCRRFRSVKWTWAEKAGKRNALKVGMEMSTGEIAVLVDSDTLWTKGTLSELMKPFADESVGGVTTYQRILDPERSVLTRFCDWMEEIRANGTMKAMSTTGKVGCLPGRTIAFRSHILNENMNTFMNERFMGIHKEVSDDRSLTNITLRAGYKTVMQDASIVYTDAPLKWKKFFRQQLRWSEGSQYNNLRMSTWMLRNARLMFFVYWSDMLTPFFLVGVYSTFILGLLVLPDSSIAMYEDNVLLLAVLTLAGASLSLGLRHYKTFTSRPSQLLFLLPFMLVLTFVMSPIRIMGFAKLADDLGWGTRKSAYKSSRKRSMFMKRKLEVDGVPA